MNFKCLAGYEKDENFICSYNNKPCEYPIGTQCKILTQLRDEYKEQLNQNYKAHENPYGG